MEENQYECTGVPAENNIYSDFMDILDNYGQLYESSSNLTIEEENVIFPEINQKKLSGLLSKYVNFFFLSKSKYDVGKIKMVLYFKFNATILLY